MYWYRNRIAGTHSGALGLRLGLTICSSKNAQNRAKLSDLGRWGVLYLRANNRLIRPTFRL